MDEQRGAGEHQPDPQGTETAPVVVPSESQDANAETQEADREPRQEGILTGTGTETAPGVGGLGDHPAPAAVRDPVRGGIRVAGEPPSGSIAPSEAPTESEGLRPIDEEARERLNAVVDHEPHPTERPDIGTE